MFYFSPEEMEECMRESYDDFANGAIKVETVWKATGNELAGIDDIDAVLVKPEPDNVILIRPELLDPLSENTGMYL